MFIVMPFAQYDLGTIVLGPLCWLYGTEYYLQIASDALFFDKAELLQRTPNPATARFTVGVAERQKRSTP
jgi:hypothetical protein